jgi:hypothetical protein
LASAVVTRPGTQHNRIYRVGVTFEPENATDIETDLKGQFFDRTQQLNFW